eukprot:171793-Rhodomonas_salina.2
MTATCVLGQAMLTAMRWQTSGFEGAVICPTTSELVRSAVCRRARCLTSGSDVRVAATSVETLRWAIWARW